MEYTRKSIKEVFMLEKLGGRKFIFGVLLIVMGFVFVILNKVTVDAFFSFAQVIGGGYILGNVATKVITKN